MLKFILATLTVLGLNATAAEYDQVYTLAKPAIVDPQTAMRAALDGKTVYSCITQEFRVSKSEKGGGLANVKKPKSDADLDKQIEDLQKMKQEN